MKLYDPTKAGTYIWPMTKGKPGEPTTYQLTNTDSADNWEKQGWQMAGPYQVGRYDNEGCFCTYLPPVDGHHGGLGRYARHPLAKQAKQGYERDLIQSRYAGSRLAS